MPHWFKSIWNKHRSVLLYLVFGGLTTLINIVVFMACDQWLRWPTWQSNGLAWLLAVLFAFVTNKLFVFESRSLSGTKLLRELGLFFAARIATGALDTLIVVAGIDWLGLNSLAVKIASNVLVVVLNYVLSKLFIFRDDRRSK